MASEIRFASASARRRASLSAGVSLGGGASTRASGSSSVRAIGRVKVGEAAQKRREKWRRIRREREKDREIDMNGKRRKKGPASQGREGERGKSSRWSVYVCVCAGRRDGG
jgi:hypothetical protein